jgi:hypothetical protein
MASLQLPDRFKESYTCFELYPTQLVYKPSYLGALDAYRSRLDDSAESLLVKTENEAFVPFRDWTGQSE